MQDLEIIKRKYGEEMMHLCRDNLGIVLEHEGLLPKLLEENFFHYKSLAHDIKAENKQEDFFAFILEKSGLIKNDLTQQRNLNQNKSAVDLMAEAGYVLYPECKTEKEIQAFRHFYFRDIGKTPVFHEGQKPESRVGEELCTFNGGRLQSCRVWFAVKKNAKDLHREDFKNPKRDDEYGTSVLSIQFSKGRVARLSIKNRYNHTVTNPDATFNNDLERIIPGLSQAFEKDYQIDNSIYGTSFELNNYVRAIDGKYYPYNFECSNIYFCPHNIIIDRFEPRQLPTHQILADNYVIDCKNKTVRLYSHSSFYTADGFCEAFNGLKNINVEKNGIIKITKADGDIAILQISKKGEIVAYKDNTLEDAGNCFMMNNRALKCLILPALKSCENYFLNENIALEELNVSNLLECGKYFLHSNKILKSINIDNLVKCDNNFLFFNENLEKLNAQNLEEAGRGFLYSNKVLNELNVEKLERCGNSFLYHNTGLKKLNLANLKECGDTFLGLNEILENIYAPNLEICGNNFLLGNLALLRIDLSKLLQCGDCFIYRNEQLSDMRLPNLKSCGCLFLNSNQKVVSIKLPNLKKSGDFFFMKNKSIEEIDLSSLTFIGQRLFNKYWKKSIMKINLSQSVVQHMSYEKGDNLNKIKLSILKNKIKHPIKALKYKYEEVQTLNI